MEIKELSFEEKYDKLYDQYLITDVIAMACMYKDCTGRGKSLTEILPRDSLFQ